MSATKVEQPTDSKGNVVERSMGNPLVVDDKTLHNATEFVDIFDLTADKYRNRAFTGLAIRNLSASTTIEIAMGEEGASTKNVVAGTQEYFILDDLMFGPNITDESEGNKTTKVRARLGTAQGTAHSATIDYSGPIQPADGDTVNIDGKIFEFSSDGSKAPANDFIVEIGASADDSWTNLVDAINDDPEKRVVASIDTGTDTVTITSLLGGTIGDAIAIADVDTGATFSAATLGGGSGGVTPVFHIW